MAEKFLLQIKGLDKVNKSLQQLAAKYGAAVGPALYAEAEIEMTEAKRRTPVLTGVLRASGHVEAPSEGRTSLTAFDVKTRIATFGASTLRRSDSVTSVRMAFGGPAAGYALAVHENLEALHHVGQAKFLESTLLEVAQYLAARVAARIKPG